MRFRSICRMASVLLTAVFLSVGCRERGRSLPPSGDAVVTAPAADLPGRSDVATPAADTVFVAMAIPPEVEARMRGVSYPEGAAIPLRELRYLRLSYIDSDGNAQVGEMVCNRRIAQDLVEVFRALYRARYPIRSIRLIDEFGGSDEASMEADNTSCFNYRPVSGGRSLSRHAQGLAVDINPLENPCIKNGTVLPPSGAPYVDRTQDFPHKIDRNDLCYKLFVDHGFRWGGAWRSLKDYQHFER